VPGPEETTTTAEELAGHTALVRSQFEDVMRAGGHHPVARYDPAAHRHYVRRRALLGALAPLQFDSVLDVGCAEGFFLDAVASRFGVEAWGIDLSPQAARTMRNRYGHRSAAADGSRLPFGDGAFDLVYSTETIEHVVDAEAFMRELRRVARRHVVVTTPASYTTASFAPDYELADEGHIQQFTPARVADLAGAARVGSFRNNTTYGIYKVVGRHLGDRASRLFVELDHLVSQRLGSASSRLWPLRNRDWLLVADVRAATTSACEWVCPSCHGVLVEQEPNLVCGSCGLRFPVEDGVPDFFGPAS
jgi:SAM-dependent methyltransferase